MFKTLVNAWKIKDIRTKMLAAADDLNFELAASLRDRLNAVEALSQKQLVTAGFEITPRRGLDHDGVLFFLFRRKGGVCNRADGNRQQRFVHCGVVHNELLTCAQKWPVVGP